MVPRRRTRRETKQGAISEFGSRSSSVFSACVVHVDRQAPDILSTPCSIV